ncbi:MAG: hypothetical protein NTZ59_15595 [Bacteroidetes bacterium]|nr:hypothetical protein [Bacteroidota bacterium]
MLSQFPNCPPDNYIEIKAYAFRWVHSNENENDFKPINLINEPPPRLLDESDKMCMGYGLSLFASLSGAFMKYKNLYTKRREHLRPIFVDDFGACIANLSLEHSDGVANSPDKKNYGHFTFHEYENIDLREKVQSTFNIFDTDGNFVD